jgi:hypothetical protein
MSGWERGSIAVERKLRRWAGGPGLLGYAVVALVVGVALLLYFLRAHINPHNAGAIGMRQSWIVVGETTGVVSAEAVRRFSESRRSSSRTFASGR